MYRSHRPDPDRRRSRNPNPGMTTWLIAASLTAFLVSPARPEEIFLAADSDGEMVLVDLDRTQGTVVSELFRPRDGDSALAAEVIGGATTRPDGSVLLAMVPTSKFDAADPQSGWGLYRFSSVDRSVQRLLDLPAAVNGITTGPGGRLYAVTFDPVRFVHIDLDDGSFTDLGTFDFEPSGKSLSSAHFADVEWIPELGQFLFVHRDVTGGFDLWSITADGASSSPVDHDLPAFSSVYHVTRIADVGVALIASDAVFLLDLETSPVALRDDDSVEPGSLIYRSIFGATPIGDQPFAPFGAFEPISGLACEPDPTTLCLQNGRFEVRARWVDPFDDTEKSAGVVQLTGDSGSFWFLQPSNQEALVKVLDTCGVNGHRWVFGSASTTLAFALEVRDTATGQTRDYTNPPGTPAPAINDTAAFPCS